MENEKSKDITLFNFLTNKREYARSWEAGVPADKYPNVAAALSKASKTKEGNGRGYPDFLYVNPASKLLILIENKSKTKYHRAKKGEGSISIYAEDGAKHYLKFFLNEDFKDWKRIALATSGDVDNKTDSLVSTFVIKDDAIQKIESDEILNEADYISLFENINLEEISSKVGSASKKINNLLRSVDSQKRPILLSALMISLYENEAGGNNFKNIYQNLEITQLSKMLPIAVETILEEENIPIEKRQILSNELTPILLNKDIQSTTLLKDVLFILDKEVLPLFLRQNNYDIIGKFYEEFLRYAGVANVKKGIVLTPRHITELFTELIPLKKDDVIFDPCCGTGAFLITAMNQLSNMIRSKTSADMNEKLQLVKEKQLIGFEKNPTMFTLSVSNMLFRGDGKSRLFNIDVFDEEESGKALESLEKEGIKPSIGFINPPYSGGDSKTNPTKKEIQFLEWLLDKASRYVVMIAPISTYMKDQNIRDRILDNHRLLYVIDMPKELFEPNATTHTAISVFETGVAHETHETIFYRLKDDGFVKTKHKGRTDSLGKWNGIKKTLLDSLKKGGELSYPIGKDEEWTSDSKLMVDDGIVLKSDFEKAITDFFSFNIKKELDLLNKDLNEVEFFKTMLNYGIVEEPVSKENISLDFNKWKVVSLGDIFDIQKGKRVVENDRVPGEYAMITAKSVNNGISCYVDKGMMKKLGCPLLENKITVDMFGNVYYHNYPYFSDDNIHTLEFKNKSYESYYSNPYVNMFLVAVIGKLKEKYNFGRQCRLDRIKMDEVLLPYKEGELDFEFMEEYIKTMKYSSHLA